MLRVIEVIQPKKPSKNALLFFTSLLIGGAGMFYSKQYIESEIALYKKTLDIKEEMIEVVVPKRNIAKGENISQEDLSLRAIPAQYIDSNTITHSTFDTAIGQNVEYDIEAGKPLLWAHLDGGQAPTLSGNVPTGLRAMTIRVDEINSISGFLQPKDKIDMLLTYGDNADKKVFPLIQNLNVIATGMQTYVVKHKAAQRPFSTITIQVTPEQAKIITLSQQVGKITAMLRNPDDESPLKDNTLNLSQVLKLPVSNKRAKPKIISRPKPKKSKPQIEYIIGGS